MAISPRLITTTTIIAGTKIVADATLGKDRRRRRRKDKSLIKASEEIKKSDKLIR